VLQIIEPIMHGSHSPEIVLSYLVAALAAGFPIVITLAWIFDVKAGRIERTAPAAGATGPKGVRLALLLVGIGYSQRLPASSTTSSCAVAAAPPPELRSPYCRSLA
jgi:hypothetical protein